MEEKMTPQEWEIRVKEQISQIDEVQLLDMAQQLAIQLAASLGDARVNMRLLQVRPEETEDMIRAEIGRMAVMLDILQLRYCDCADEELAFLDELAECTEA